MKTTTIKAFVIVLLLASCTISGFSQAPTKANAEELENQKKVSKEEVPQDVTNAFYKDYPTAPDPDWYAFPAYDHEITWWYNWYDHNTIDTTGLPDYYEAKFIKDETVHKVVYHKNGKRMATHKQLKKEVPKPVLDSIATSQYKTWKLGKEKEEIFKDKDHMKVYKIEVENGTQKHALFYQQDGKLLKDRKIS